MTDVRTNRTLQNVLLMGALAAGTFATQFVPAYQEHAGKVTYPSRAAASRADAANEKSPGFSHTRNDGPELTIVRSAS
jgi:hypothetical protein